MIVEFTILSNLKYLIRVQTRCVLLSLVVCIIANLGINNQIIAQCDPSTIEPCDIGNNSIIQASFHAQIAKTSNGYSITGQDFDPNGTAYSTILTNIPSAIYPMPDGILPVWGALGGRTQAVFLATDNKIYAIGEEDLLIDETKTNGPAWNVTNLTLPSGLTVCDINKWEGAAGSGSDSNNGSNATGERDGFLVCSTYAGDTYIIGNGAKAIQQGASNTDWTLLDMPDGIDVINFGVGYRTLLVLGSDNKLYAAGPTTYLGDGSSANKNSLTLLVEQPDVSVFGITQIEAGFHSYFVLDGDGTIHVLGQNSEGALGVATTDEVLTWSKVGMDCPQGILDRVAYISTMSTHDHHISSSAILVDGTIRSWGSNNKQSITSGENMLITCPVIPTGNNKNAVAISNGGHISPYVNTAVEICNIGHNRQGAFGDGNDEEGDYGEYRCRIIPGMPEICGTKEANLALKKSVSDMTPSTGQNIVFSITVTNLGPEASTGSFVRDQLSDAFYYISDDSEGDYDYITGLWNVGPLEVGASKTLRITTIVIASGTQSNYAQILVDNEVDFNSTPGDNSSSEDDDDKIFMNVTPCPIAESDLLLCPEDSVLIDNVWITQSGTYLERVSINSECDSLHITNVSYVENPPMPGIQIDCEQQVYQLYIDESTNWLPTWENGSNASSITYNADDTQTLLSLQIAPNCIEEINIDLPAFANIDDIPNLLDTIVLENSTFSINLGLDSTAWQVQWSPSFITECTSCMSVQLATEVSTQVSLYLEHSSGCNYVSSFFLDIEKAPENMYIPNVFTPNGDLNNDAWTFYTTPNITVQHCIIYDRWGSQMFTSYDPNPSWNGTLQGVDCEIGVYVYLIKYKDSDGNDQVITGDLTLLR